MNVQDLIKEGVKLFKNKKFDEAIEKLNQALDGIEDKDSQIQVHNNIHFWLGRCYLEQAMKAEEKEVEQWCRQAVEQFQLSLKFAKQMADEQKSLQEQGYVQSWLGHCYLEQAMKAKGKDSEQLFGRAVEHFQLSLGFAKQLTDEQNSLQSQVDAQAWLGRCYLEQAMKVAEKEAKQLFEQVVKHRQQQLNLAKQLIDDQNSLQQQLYAQFWLGYCYLEQAMKAQGKELGQLFEQAIEHHKRQLSLAKHLTDEQNSLQQQLNAQHWLGRCYLEQAMKAEEKEVKQWCGQAIEQFQMSLEFAKQLIDKQNSLQEQHNAQAWLGRCYLEQAMKAQGKELGQLFEQAIEHHKRQLSLAKHLTDEQNSLQQQLNAQYWLGRCYLEQAISIKDKKTTQAKKLSKRAEKYFLSAVKRLSKLINKSERERLKKRINELLHDSYFPQEKWQNYFDQKKQGIREKLFENIENKKDDLTDAISTILAVLNIPPIELGAIPLSHYTSPSVCERLFGIVSDKANDKVPVDSNKVSPMRIGSSTYMNDPTEGEGLMELLNLQDLELENKADCPVYNAFFTCFSSRINDLNQFRLYGKENSVEASGCCLVFNKKVRWLKGSNVLESFRRLTDKSDEAPETSAEVSDLLAVNLPLYQVAYIAYKDEYIAEEKCRIWLPNKDNPKFGIRLKSFGNKGWHEYRIGKLEEALKQLIKIFEGKANISDEDRKALEYIRYLFKDFAFRDEEEFRLLKIEQIGSDNIKYCQTTKSVYLPYADIRDIVDEVILGTNYEKSGKERKAEVFQHLMRKHYPNVKVSRSSLPINANPPIKKD